jgi:hypothetical protein
MLSLIRIGPSARHRAIKIFALRIAASARSSTADIFRALLLLLVGLLGLCAALMCFTGRYDIGTMVIGCVLLVGLVAANWAR